MMKPITNTSILRNMAKSIIQFNKECYVCKTRNNLHRHEIFFGKANRKKSIEDGCTVYLCGIHHNLSNEGVHFDKELDAHLKRLGEICWLTYYDKEIPDFIKRYGKSYL